MTTSDATGERAKRRSVPSYMKPTATSKLKENVYGVDQRFTLIKSRCASPEHHELDYIPPPPPPPGVPSFMRPTKTWGGKVSDKDRRKPRSKIRRRASCNAAMQSTTAANTTTTNAPIISASFEPTTPSPPQRHLPSSPTSNSSNSSESTCTTKPKPIVVHAPPLERRRSSYCLAPRPSVVSTFDEISFVQSRPSTLAEAIRETLIRTAPVSYSRKLESMEGCHASTAVGPPTPTMKHSRSRRKGLPRYMRPTVASKARLRE